MRKIEKGVISRVPTPWRHPSSQGTEERKRSIQKPEEDWHQYYYIRRKSTNDEKAGNSRL